MKVVSLLIFLFAFSIGYSQTLPINFEETITTSDFTDFDGGTATVIENPQSSGIDTSSKVAQIIRNGGQIWAGSKIALAANLDFTTMNMISMKVFTTAPIGTPVKFKLEGSGASERDVLTTVTGEWEELTWDFTGEPSNFNNIVFMFDFGKVGDGSSNSTFLFDDIQQLSGGIQIDLPVDFQDTTVNYTMSDFGGNLASLITDPLDPSNQVMQVVKTDQAATWAGTTIGTPAGFASNIPLSLTDSKMTVKVWSPEAGTPIRLKVEDSKDPTHTCETETNTTVSAEWEVLEFDFANQATGTESLSVGLSMGWTYNKASIFFNFGTEGALVGEKTYYFDDVKFGELVLGITKFDIDKLSVFPNPTNHTWTMSAENSIINRVEVYDFQGKLILVQSPNSQVSKINAINIAKGPYVVKISTDSGTSNVKLVKN